MSRRICIAVTQTKTECFECEVPDNMTDEEALEQFRDNKEYGWLEPDDTELDNIEFEVRGKGNEKNMYPHIIVKEKTT